MAQVRPRPKPAPDALGAATTPMAPIADSPGDPVPPAVPAVTTNLAAIGVPLPRAKPAPDVAAVAPAAVPLAPETTVAPKPTVQALAPAASPPGQPAAPVVIVSAPTTDTSIGVEISGVAQDLAKPSKASNPTEGFAVLGRVRFVKGKSEIPAQAQQALDTLAQRLLTSQERVRLAAFSGKAGDKSSDARRMSLARALAIRSYLVAKGVAVDRVDVLAFGGATDGISDRVDVLVRGI
jgi:outer membrane protein OmpA-like peptidoglycan-associated protein